MRVRLAILLKTEGRLGEAETVLREVITRFPRNERARTELQDISLKRAAVAEPAPVMPAAAEEPPKAAEPPAASMMPEHTVVDRSGFDLLFAAPGLAAPDTWKTAGAELTVPGETALTGEPAGMRIRLRRPVPRPELIIAGCIVLLLSLMWQLRGYAPNGHLLQRSADITLPSGTAPVLPAASPPATTIVVSEASIPAPRPDVASQQILSAPPPSVVEASPLPALPAAAPAAILILYRQGEPGAALQASRLAGRLRAASAAVTVQAKAIATPGQAEIGYIFAEDRASALAISAQLDGRFGPVRQVAQRRHRPGVPGAVTIAMP